MKKEPKRMFDLIIIGAGPAGLAAGIYASRYELKFLIIGKVVGGVANEAYLVENYPGFKSISGIDLIKKFEEHLGKEIEQKNVEKLLKEEAGFKVVTRDSQYQTKTIILALGTQVRKLNIPGAKKFEGKGISYCVTCDAILFKDKTVAVNGGGNAALTGAMELADFCPKVYLIHRRDEFRGSPHWVKKVKENPKIELILKANVIETKGREFLESIVLDNGQELKVNGLFIEIGSTPATALAKDIGVELNDEDYIIVNKAQATNIGGVFAAGDMTTGSNNFKQIVTAAAEGAIAAFSAYNYERSE